MLSLGNVDSHHTRQTYQIACSRVRYDGARQLTAPSGNYPAVLQYKRATLAPENTGDVLHRHLSGRSLDAGAERKHMAVARSLQVAVELLIEAEPIECGVLVRCLCGELHFEVTGSCHTDSLGRRRAHAASAHKEPGGFFGTNGLARAPARKTNIDPIQSHVPRPGCAAAWSPASLTTTEWILNVKEASVRPPIARTAAAIRPRGP